jgi:hypothetical protein
MLLSSAERTLLEAACANRDNEMARKLKNLFGVSTVDGILEQVAAAPVTVRLELIDEVRKAIDEQRRFRPRR